MSDGQQSRPIIVIGSSGYVGGEFLRLIGSHPNLSLGAAVSTSLAGMPICETFGHLRSMYPEQRFVDIEDAVSMLGDSEHWLLLSAAPHRHSAPLVQRFVLTAAEQGTRLSVVDASADFRFADAAAYEAVYGQAHPCPSLLEHFTCAVPEHHAQLDTPHASQPGCFASSMLLGIVPLLAAELIAGDVYVSAVTGSTGAGRTLRQTTHHPERQSNLFAYQPLRHRHSPEVEALAAAATGQRPELRFVPHSGPFARGIHATIFARSASRTSKEDVTEVLTDFYSKAELVEVLAQPPRVKDVAGSAFAALSCDVDGDTIVVCSVIDNLLKGAASGAIQWVNRMLGLPDATGLTSPATGWQ